MIDKLSWMTIYPEVVLLIVACVIALVDLSTTSPRRTGTYLLIQTMVVIVWIVLNVFAVSLRWDPYPFILLNLAFSTQAAYAAPLILLAQNRQENRDRVTLEQDRRRAEETKADTEYLARELASLRLAMGDVAKTRESLRRELEDLRDLLRDRPSGARPGSDDGVDQHAASPH